MKTNDKEAGLVAPRSDDPMATDESQAKNYVTLRRNLGGYTWSVGVAARDSSASSLAEATAAAIATDRQLTQIYGHLKVKS